MSRCSGVVCWACTSIIKIYHILISGAGWGLLAQEFAARVVVIAACVVSRKPTVRISVGAANLEAGAPPQGGCAPESSQCKHSYVYVMGPLAQGAALPRRRGYKCEGLRRFIQCRYLKS